MSSKGGDSVQALLLKLKVDYVNKTPTQLKIIDVFLAFVMATAGVLLTYCILFGSFPFNAFLAAFIGCVGTFIMAVILRMQLNLSDFPDTSKERAVADFVVGEVVLFFFVFCFIG